ncbi:MAG: TspO/MBR family protein [Acidobacteriaceae bacterium]
MSKSRSALALLGFATAAAGAAWVGSRYSPRDLRTRIWYRRLSKSPLNPPDAVFPIVWSALYSMMSISAWRVSQTKPSPERTRALCLWAAQLAANAEWTRLFFGKHRPKRALIDIFLLEALILLYIDSAKEIDGPAAALFTPYAAWVAFAALLNAEIVRRNPDGARKFPRAA